MKKTSFIFVALAFFFIGAKAQINLVSNGYVMIGSSVETPITPLHVIGSTYIPSGNSYWIGATSDAGSRLRLHNDGNNSFLDYSQNLFFRYGSTYSEYGVALHSNGCMSIGYGYWTYLHSAPAYPLVVNGYILASGTILPSDSRLKKNIEDLSNNKSKLFKLKGVMFDYNSEIALTQNGVSQLPKSIVGNTSKSDTLKNEPISTNVNPQVTSRKHFGFIAQDLQKVFPELVFEDKEGYLSVDYTSIIPMLVEALKEQDAILTIQASQIKELQKLSKNGKLKIE